jgi:hypothetical protein
VAGRQAHLLPWHPRHGAGRSPGRGQPPQVTPRHHLRPDRRAAHGTTARGEPAARRGPGGRRRSGTRAAVLRHEAHALSYSWRARLLLAPRGAGTLWLPGGDRRGPVAPGTAVGASWRAAPGRPPGGPVTAMGRGGVPAL